MDFDYKKYSLEQLENWVHDAVSGEASPQEIYDIIKGVVDEQYHYFKHHTGRCYDLLCLLNGNGKYHTSGYEDSMPPWGHSDLEYAIANKKEDKVVRWSLHVQVDGLTGDCYVIFPDDLLEAANLKEGDQVEWVYNGDGTYTIRHKTMVRELNPWYAEALAEGYTPEELAPSDEC